MKRVHTELSVNVHFKESTYKYEDGCAEMKRMSGDIELKTFWFLQTAINTWR